MCLILFAYRYRPKYELLLAANRDEYYNRPTAPMAFWEDAPDLLAGRDLAAGGTWFGVTRQGRFAAITNYRDPRTVRPEAPSRGPLVSDYLRGRESAWDYLQHLLPRAALYNGFNLLLGDAEGLFYYSNQGGAPQVLEPGLYGLSNHLLSTPWPKVKRGLEGLAALLDATTEPDTAALLRLLEDRRRAPDHLLPNTGVDLEWERLLSPLFIESPNYGTRSSTVLRIGRQDGIEVTEKTWPEGSVRAFHFRLKVKG
ncbi:MAG: NRDE family protein [Candidatus Competibacteraceae bacterium]